MHETVRITYDKSAVTFYWIESVYDIWPKKGVYLGKGVYKWRQTVHVQKNTFKKHLIEELEFSYRN